MKNTVAALEVFLVLGLSFFTKGHGQNAVPGELIVMFRPGAYPSGLLHNDPNFRTQRVLSQELRIFLMAYDTLSLSPEAAIRRLYARKDIELAQRNHYLSPRKPTLTPSDPLFGQQWSHENTGQAGGSPDADMDTDEAWDLSTGGINILGDSVIAAVIDGGFDLLHPELTFWKNKLETPGNGLDDDQNGYVDDYNGWNAFQNNGNVPGDLHGTHVTGIVSAKGNNGTGIAGVNWHTPILPVAGASSQEATAVAAYSYVLAQRRRYNRSNGQEGAWVVAVNSSFGVDFGLPVNFPIWCAIYDSMGVEGILNVGATMNNGSDVDLVSDIPSACSSEYLVTVTNTNRRDQRNAGAAFGLTTIDLGAPGTDILSTVPGGSTGFLTGTSMAAPQVTGILALMYAYACPALAWRARTDPAGTALIMKQLLLQGVDSLPQFAASLLSGGRANARGALREIDEWCADNGGNCLPPHGVSLANQTDSSATLSWIRPLDADSVFFLVRKSGDQIWTAFVATDSIQLHDLARCTVYEVSLASFCSNGDTSFFAPALTFSTRGCCEPPLGFSYHSPNENAVLLSWKSNESDSVQITLTEQPLGNSILFTTSDTSLVLQGLLPCTAYQVTLSAFCDTVISAKTSILTFNTLGCGLCQDPGYCGSAGNSATDEWIAKVEIGPISRTSTSDGGYADATFPPATLLADTIYNFTLTPGFSGFAFQEKWNIWLDLNADTLFQDPEEKLFGSAIGSGGAVKGQIRIPLITDTLNARLRISMKFAGFSGTPPALPCDTFSFGEVEDYCVTLLPHVSPCQPPASFSVTTIPDSQSVRIAWKPYFKADGYLLSFRETGTANWIFLPLIQPQVLITTLPSCKEFEWRVASICGADTTTYSDTLRAWSYGCGACLDKKYCTGGGNINSGSAIESVSLGDTYFYSGNDLGYRAVQPEESIVWYRDSSLSYVLKGQSSSAWAGAYWRGWLDLNGDGDFLDAGEEMINSGLWAPDTFAGQIPFPALSDTLPTLLRLRIAMSRAGAPGACDLLADGEVEDYCIRINTPLSVQNPEAQNALSPFPNPANQSITLTSFQAISSVRLFDLQGKCLLMQQGNQRTELQLKLPALPAGLYLVAVTSKGLTSWHRLAIDQE